MSQDWSSETAKTAGNGAESSKKARPRGCVANGTNFALWPGMETLRADLRYALRTLGRAPAFTAAAALALALGIGGSTALFSVLDGVVLRPLAAPRPDDLVRLYEVPTTGDHVTFSTADYMDIAHEAKSFESVAAVWPAKMNITLDSGPVRIPSAYVTASFFSTLKVFPALGRALSPEEDLKGAPRSIVITDQLWKREFGGDRRVLGQSLVLDGKSYTVVGVMPRNFSFPILRGAEALVPFEFEPDDLKNRGGHYLSAFARLRQGVTARAAQSELEVMAPRLAAKMPDLHTGWKQLAVPLLPDLVGNVRPALQALLGAVILVLLIACANVASMLLARGAARQRELAIRAALGSGRGRLVRQLLTEAILLGLCGGALGMILAAWGVDVIVSLAPKTIPRLDEVRLDGAVLVFGLCAALLSGMLAGLVPALQASRTDVVEALKNGGAGSTARGRARAALVVVEVALALVLAVGAGLMIRTVQGLLAVPVGISDPGHVLVADLDLPDEKYGKPEQVQAFQREAVRRISALPGVKSAAFANTVPLGSAEASLAFEIEGAPPRPAGQLDAASVVWATHDYLRTMGIPLLRGRDFASTDVEGAPGVVLVNQAFERKFFPGQSALDHMILKLGRKLPQARIVGIAGDVRAQALDKNPEPQIIIPLEIYPWPYDRLVVRTVGDPLAAAPLVRTEVLAMDKDQPLGNPRRLDEVMSASLGERRFQMTLLALFGGIALSLAALGIYGVIAYSVAQRSREIGIRMALGAPAAHVERMVVGAGLKLAGLGIALGSLGAFALTRSLQTVLYQVSALDPVTFLAVAGLLAAVAALACWAPARRAARVDPMLSLRAE
ncbi:MAG: ABC transporter permease [Deltaproteobacteria bacterium]|nr:MAG: ABC transporter permease [Deltaproteobacteria bacterium]